MFQTTLWSATASCAGSATGWGTSRTRTTRWCRRSGRSARWCPSTRSTTCRTYRWKRWTASARVSSLAARRQDGCYRPRCWRWSAPYTRGLKRLCGRGLNLICERGCLLLPWVRACRSLWDRFYLSHCEVNSCERWWPTLQHVLCVCECARLWFWLHLSTVLYNLVV